MEAIICCMFGVFVGMATAGYMCVRECEQKERIIAEQKEENLQVCSENKELRAELEDTQDDNMYLEKQLSKIGKIVNDYDIAENKVTKLKELVDTRKTNN